MFASYNPILHGQFTIEWSIHNAMFMVNLNIADRWLYLFWYSHISAVLLQHSCSNDAEMEKQRWEESERTSQEVRRSEKRKSRKQEDAGARKGRKVAIHCVFPMICGSAGSKSNLGKAAGAEPAGQMRDKKLHAVVPRSTFVSKKGKNASRSDHFWKLRCRKSALRWREAHFQVKMYKTPHVRITFGSWDVEKVHNVVVRSTFPSQNVQNTPISDHFWKLRCRKSARRCGAKHISKSKCTKHTNLGPLLEVELSKKCTPLWREARFQVKMVKTQHVRTTFWRSDVEKVHAAVARNTFPSQKCKKTGVLSLFWR